MGKLLNFLPQTPPNHTKALVTVMVYGPESICNIKDATAVTVI